MKVAAGHQAYEPPVPKHLIPTNNPFYNKQMTIGSDSYGGGDRRGGLGSSESEKIDRPTPRSLLNWINSSNTKRVQQRITNRIQYLKQMSQNRLGPATIGHEQTSTAFESQNDKTTSAGA